MDGTEHVFAAITGAVSLSPGTRGAKEICESVNASSGKRTDMAGNNALWQLDETHDPLRTSWVESANGHPMFPLQNLPLGVFAPPDGGPRIGVAIGDYVLDLAAAATLLPSPLAAAASAPSLNELLGLPTTARAKLRRILFNLLSCEARQEEVTPLLVAAADCMMGLPAAIGGYSDFYTGINHALNVGRQFRPDHPLLPNYKWIPIGYHGRTSSIRPSGAPVVRPLGQIREADAAALCLGPCRQLDYELEMAVWVGGSNELGKPVAITQASEFIAGFGLLNDWSARDIQRWEYQPLGPFLAKSFHSTVSAWVVTAEAMAPFRASQPRRAKGDPAPLPHLWDEVDQQRGALSVDLEAHLSTAVMRERGIPPHRLSSGRAADNMYWTVAQIVTHQASNGCNLQPGDLLGTGTLSSASEAGLGSLLEITRGGTAPVKLATGETRTFLEDGDEIALSAVARADGFVPIGFGECTARIVSAPPI